MLKKISIFIFLFMTLLYGVKERNIETVVTSNVEKVLSILQNKSLSPQKKEKQSIQIMENIFNYKIMAKISLGKYWKKLSKRERKQFTIAFEQKLKHSYTDKLKLYTDQKVISKGLKKVKSNRIILRNDIIGKNDTYTIIYLFYKNAKNNDWLIYDVKLEGVSIIQTYRKQFAEFLKTKTFNQLLNTL